MTTITTLARSAAPALGFTLCLAGAAIAQPTNTKKANTPLRPPVSATALPFDLVAVYQGPGAIYESWTEDKPCTPHSHTWTSYIKAGRRSGPFPDPTATLYKDGQPIETWSLAGTSGNTTVTLGKFTWTKDHPCPGSGNATVGPAPAPNYRLVIDPGNVVSEHSESNNTVWFYVDPGVSLVKLP